MNPRLGVQEVRLTLWGRAYAVRRSAATRVARLLRRPTGVLGLRVLPSSFEDPVPDAAYFENLTAPSELPGIDLDLDAMETMVRDFVAAHRSLFLEWQRSTDPRRYHPNLSFSAVDAAILYGMVRSRPPSRVLEIGAGYSTLVTAEAMRDNAADGDPGRFTALDRFPRRFLRRGVAGLDELLAMNAQDMPLDMVSTLGRDDILFIDSSHVVKSGSDVHFLFCEVLPRLHRGVRVHIHDIFLPFEYPRTWVMDDLRFLNEQYLLQAMLANGSSWRTRWAGCLMHAARPDALSLFPGHDPSSAPSSYWIERVDEPEDRRDLSS